MLSQGCWQQAGGHGADVFSDLQGTLAAHAKAGFTSFDTADIYSQSEGECVAAVGRFAAVACVCIRVPQMLLASWRD